MIYVSRKYFYFLILIFAFISTLKAGMDTVVVYSAKDTVHFNVNSRSMYMKGTSTLNMTSQQLESETIKIDFKNNTLEANGDVDSVGTLFGFPKFVEKGETYYGESITYNYRTNKGIIKQGETGLMRDFTMARKLKG